MTDVRLLTSRDLDGALALSSTAGWNQQLDDWRMLLMLAPRGSFAALDGDRIVGTSIGIDYGGFGWIAMMLVDPSYRGRGLGRRLLEVAMDAVPSDRPIRLDATPLGRPLYERYGFVDEASLSRHVSQRGGRHLDPAADLSDVHAMSTENLAAISQQDVDTFGGRRADVLEWASNRAPEYAYVASDRSGLRHYCFGRRGRLFDQIGPVVTDDDDLARRLVGAALQRTTNRPVAIDAFDARIEFTGWLRGIGFDVERPLFRMRRPASGRANEPHGHARSALPEFVIFGPEFG